MTTNLQTYPKYKDSGVEWTKKIPGHWSVQRVKTIFHLVKRPIRESDDIVTAFRDGMVTLRKNRKEDGFTIALQESGYQGIRKGDLVISGMDGFAGAIGISDSDGKSSPVYSVCVSNNNNVFPPYYAYLLRTLALTGYISIFARGIRERSTEFKWNTIGVLSLLLLPVETQQHIADFLDERINIIEELISRKEKLIELQKDYINSLVLENNIPFNKNIGFWNNFSPDWKLEKARWIFDEINIRNKPSEEPLAVTQNRGVLPKEMCEEQFVSSTNPEVLKLVEVSDFVISLRSFEGGIEFSNYKGIVSPAYTVIRLKKNYNNNYYQKFYKYLLKTPQFITLLNTIIMGIRDGKNINYSDFGGLILPIPTTDSINKMIKEFEKYERLVFYFEKEKKLLNEYRSSLIYSAVTGKIKV